MGIVIERYVSGLEPAVQAFNDRLASKAVSSDFRFPPPEPSGERSPNEPHRRFEESFVAVDAGNVRGGYILRHHEFVVRGTARSIAQYRLPLSEGIIDRRHVGVGVRLLKHAMASHPMLFALGMGGVDNPLPRMLKAFGWRLSAVPFFFRACHPQAVVRTLVRQDAIKLPRGIGAAAAKTGVAGAAVGVVHWMLRSRPAAGVSWKVVEAFDDAADVVWRACADQYVMVAVRTSPVLNALYPPSDFRFLRVVISRDGAAVGWIVLLDTPMTEHRQFGNLRVGSVVDGLARPEDADVVANVAANVLEARGVDLIASNQKHAAWTRAMRRAGLLPGPTNFVFACSPALGELLEPFDSNMSQVHLTRGDGDGPIHL